jgi:hypothetical protein
VTAADHLRRRADEYQALGEEHTTGDDPMRFAYAVVELALRELAMALETEQVEEAA